MLDRLSGRQQTGIERWRTLVFLHDLGALIGNADNGVAGLGLRLFVDRAEDLFKSRDMALRLASVLLEGLFRSGDCAAFAIFGSVARIFFSAKYMSFNVS
jgi:hypothetical protein